MPRDEFGHAAKPDHMFEQATDVGVMHDLGGGCALITLCRARISDDLKDQLLEPRIFQRVGIAEKITPHFFDVVWRVWQIVGDVDLIGARDAALDHGELWPVAVQLDARLNFDEIITIDVLSDDFKLVPHAGFDGAAAIAEFKTQVSATFARVAHFFFVYEEKSGDGLFGEQLRDE